MKAHKISLVTAIVLSITILAVPAFAQDEGGEGQGEAAVQLDGPEEPGGNPGVAKKHQLDFGLGWGWLGAMAFGGVTGGGFYPALGLGWVSIPMMYHYRYNERLAFGGGLVLTLIGAGGGVGGSLNAVGGVRIYAIREILWFDANIMLGFPLLAGLVPAVGHTWMFTDKVGLQLKNEFMLAFLPSFFGDNPVLFTWITSVAVEIRF